MECVYRLLPSTTPMQWNVDIDTINSGYYEFAGVNGQFTVAPQPAHSDGALSFEPAEAVTTVHGENTKQNFRYKTDATRKNCH